MHFDKWKQLTVSTEFFYLKTSEVFLDTSFWQFCCTND